MNARRFIARSGDPHLRLREIASAEPQGTNERFVLYRARLVSVLSQSRETSG